MTRFADLRNTAAKFQVLNEKHFFDPKSIERINELGQFYSEDLNDAESLVDEYCAFRDVFKGMLPDGAGLFTAEILPFLIANYLHRAHPNLEKLYRIYLTVPISSAQAEQILAISVNSDLIFTIYSHMN